MQGANWHKATLFLLLLSAFFIGQAQVTAILTPRDKMVKVGMPFEVELSVRHPERTVVIFPDSAKDFKPYEVESGLPMPTNTNDGISEDVKLYKLYTWEIDSIQYLQFPVRFLDSKGDTQTIQSNRAEVLFLPEIPAYSDSLKFKVVESLAEVREPINLFAWAVVILVLVIVLVLIVVFSYRPVRNYLRRLKIEREYKKYLNQLKDLEALGNNQVAVLTGLNKVWRNYFDRDRQYALSALTTTELKSALPNLKSIDDSDRTKLEYLSYRHDMVVFAGAEIQFSEILQFFEHSKAVMQKEFQRRKEALEL